MIERGVDRVEAILILGNRSSEIFGDGDVVCLHPLTDARRQRLGLGRDFQEVLAEQRARQTREAAAPKGPGGREPSDSGAEASAAGSRRATRRRGDRSR